MAEATPKPQLHFSMLEMMYRCGIQWQRRYGHRFGVWDREEIIKPGVALITGSATHVAAAGNLQHKIDNDGALLPIEAVRDLARDAVQGAWDAGVRLTDDEAVNPRKTLDAIVDTTVALSELHAASIAPMLTPLAVEEPFVIELEGYPCDLAGTVDVREFNVLSDLKTAARKPSGNPAESMQLAMYSMDYRVRFGVLPLLVQIHTLTKTKVPAVHHHVHTPTDGWIEPLKARLLRSIEIIDAVKTGKLPMAPVNSEGPSAWVCSRKYCGYADTCEFFSGRE